MATTVTVKRQVTLPKALADAAGIQPGDKVEPRLLPTGQIVIEKVSAKDPQAYRKVLEDMMRRRPARLMTTDDLMKLTRGED